MFLRFVRSYTIGPGQFRIMLAIAVLVSHLAAVETGRVAVVLFFMLSGYWVTITYQRKYSAAAHPIGHFYFARALRIFPTYYLVLALTLAGFAIVGRPLGLNITDITLVGLARASHVILVPAWSLDIELQFYLVVPLMVWAVGAAPSGARVGLFLAVALALTVAGWAFHHTAGAASLPRFAIAFAIGAAGAFTGAVVSSRMAMASLLIFVVLGVASLIVPGMQWILLKSIPDLINRDIVALAWGMIMVPFVLWVVKQPSSLADQHLGNLAYTLYLTQWFFVSSLGAFTIFQGVTGAIMIAFATGVTTTAIYFVAEAPIERWRKSLLASPRFR